MSNLSFSCKKGNIESNIILQTDHRERLAEGVPGTAELVSLLSLRVPLCLFLGMELRVGNDGMVSLLADH